MSFYSSRGRGRRSTFGHDRQAPNTLSNFGAGSMMSGQPTSQEYGQTHFIIDTMPQQSSHPQVLPPFPNNHISPQQPPHQHQHQLQNPQHQQRSASYHALSSHQQYSHQFSSPPPRLYHQALIQISPVRPPMGQSLLQIPHIVDASALRRAVIIDAESTFQQLLRVHTERNELRMQVNSLTRDFESIKIDYAALMKGHVKMEQIWLEKQLLMWKYAERLKKGEIDRIKRSVGDAAAGEWMHEEGEEVQEQSVTKEEVDRLWSSHFRIESDSSLTNDGVLTSFDDEERGRSRSVKTVEQMSSDVASTIGGETSTGLSVEESVDNELSETLDTRLDPTVEPFQPSPSRKMGGTPLSTTTTALDTPLTAIPTLSFRDVLRGTPTISRSSPPSPTLSEKFYRNRISPEKPWIEVKHRKADQKENLQPHAHNSKRSSSAASYRRGARGNGGTRRGKTTKSRAGSYAAVASFPHDSSNYDERRKDSITSLRSSTTQGSSHTQYSGSREMYPGYIRPPSPRKLDDPWRVRQSVTGEGQVSPVSSLPVSTPRRHLRVRPAKYTSGMPERPVNLSLVDSMTSDPFTTPSIISRIQDIAHEASALSHHGDKSEIAARSRTIEQPQVDRPDSASISTSKNKVPVFMSRARLQATLQSISTPYDKICPNSLLTGELCHETNCTLLQLCPYYIESLMSLDRLEAQEDFPALGASTSTITPIDSSISSTCKAVKDQATKEGDICSAGYIHLKPSCATEINTESCRFWDLPPRQVSSSESLPPPNAAITDPVTTTLTTKPKRSASTSNKKFKSLNLDYNYTAPPPDLQRPSARNISSTSLPCSTSQRKASSSDSGNSTEKRSLTQAELRDIHFRTFVHERDGIGRDAWHARRMNAELRNVHESGIWGVSVGSWASDEEEEDDIADETHDSQEAVAHANKNTFGNEQEIENEERRVSPSASALKERNEIATAAQHEKVDEKGTEGKSDVWGLGRLRTKKFVPAPADLTAPLPHNAHIAYAAGTEADDVD